ncbi:uncharacterized protein BDZ83DRAFT_641462 [Colletotrichum acutatum]|uniref:Uncharacterized protein n=1 Tax=Glomerella acutata TaxID=27357 RepID=A0AAD8X9Y6_GLOAC|nr:uncharacterized protein BDZ83DRAFT_641462 [Colletotrichum acutatum]KAK1709392.1 hypothetical protein BDZ83DRAFT_641462 [Colletotrichum acutatum]
MVQLNQVKEQDNQKRSILTSASAVLGAMILDSQNSALSILLITKETLASILVKGFLHDLSTPLAGDKNGCNSIQVFWWGRLRSFPYDLGPKIRNSGKETNAFWIYYMFRCILYAQSSFHALMNTQIFHKAQKDDAFNLEGITHPSLGKGEAGASKKSWRSRLRAWLGAHSQDVAYIPYPTTVSLMYIVYGLFMVAAMAAAEITIGGDSHHAIFKEKKDEDDQALSIGQIIAIVVAAVTITRGLWLFFMLFIKGGEIKNIKEGFRWPLHLQFDN